LTDINTERYSCIIEAITEACKIDKDMASLRYKLEYNWDEVGDANSGVYIHLRENPPIYLTKTNKEDYDILPEENKHVWMAGIFAIAGITEASSQCYRIWVKKSPAFTWAEVTLPLLHFMRSWFEYDGLLEIQGSDNVEGAGAKFIDSKDRRER